MYGRLDCLINNVGVHPFNITIDNCSSEFFRKQLEVNTVSNFIVTKYALPHLRKTQGIIWLYTIYQAITSRPNYNRFSKIHERKAQSQREQSNQECEC